MSNEYDNDSEEMTVYCDGCSETITYTGDYMSCIQSLKADGWMIKKEGHDWHHYCPSCKGVH